MTFEYIDLPMKTKIVMIMVLFIVAVCVISLIPFSNMYSIQVNEGFNGNIATSLTQTTAITGNASPIQTTAITGNASPSTTTPFKPVATFPVNITTNIELINAVIYVFTNSSDKTSDMLYIQKIQSYISNIKSQNAATLMGEISNPINLTDTKLFLQYINWFASHCPLESDTCTGLC